MNSGFVSGTLAAWAVAYCSVAVFFVFAHFWSRRDQEYLPFGLFALSLAVMNAGCALVFYPEGAPEHFIANRIAVSGGVFASAFQVQFALRYSGRGCRWKTWTINLLALVLLAWTWSVHWDLEPGFDEQGNPVLFLRQAPWLGVAFALATFTGLLSTVLLMMGAYRRGKPEALLLMVAVFVVGAFAMHDVLLIFTPPRPATEFLSPHFLWVYVIAMAATLVLRYRGAEGLLAEAASSLQARTEELRRSHAQLEKVQSELVRKEQMAAVGELAASIAHEVRNPLAVIVNANAGLRRNNLNEQDRETLLSILDEETERLNRLVAELLRFARPVSAKRSAVSLAELFEEIQRHIHQEYRMSVEIPDDPAFETVWVDPGLFRVVLDNLVSNACQAMRAGGVVAVSVRKDAFEDGREAIAIDVIDQGHGMEAPVLERALSPFFTTRPSGTGLGLPIVQRIVEAHGGDLQLTSQPGSGTTATLRIPNTPPASSTSSERKLPVEFTANLSEKRSVQ